MSESAKLELKGQSVELPVVVGSEQEHAVDISKLRAQSGYITLDNGFGNTGSCESQVTFIDGEKGILRYRGVPIDQLAQQSNFLETAWLLIFGNLPTADELSRFTAAVEHHQALHESILAQIRSFPTDGPPMAILSSMINAASCYHTDLVDHAEQIDFVDAAARLLAKTRAIAAATYRARTGQPMIYPKPGLGYAENFLHMMFSKPYSDYLAEAGVSKALEAILILHADHEQNCSTSTVRMVASSGANVFASCAAGVCALWGPLHGGANLAVIQQLRRIQDAGGDVEAYMEQVKTDPNTRLMGFGHRVYKNFDPRAKIIKQAADTVLQTLGVEDPLLDIAKQLEEVALNDDYFVKRKLYPNVDFYSGIIMRAMGIPSDMFTVMFAMGRMAGWVAHFKEVNDTRSRIYRPRQVYTGPTQRDYAPVSQRR